MIKKLSYRLNCFVLYMLIIFFENETSKRYAFPNERACSVVVISTENMIILPCSNFHLCTISI